MPDPCYFCGRGPVTRFAEHWTFCPCCAAIYTYMIIWKASCEHITPNYTGDQPKNTAPVPVVRSDCWFKKDREAKIYIKYKSDKMVCSKCGDLCDADGWQEVS